MYLHTSLNFTVVTYLREQSPENKKVRNNYLENKSLKEENYILVSSTLSLSYVKLEVSNDL